MSHLIQFLFYFMNQLQCSFIMWFRTHLEFRSMTKTCAKILKNSLSIHIVSYRKNVYNFQKVNMSYIK